MNWIRTAREWWSMNDSRSGWGEQTSFSARLESCVDGAFFDVTVDVLWPPFSDDVPPRVSAAVERQLLSAMRETARRLSVSQPDETRAELTLRLDGLRRQAEAGITLEAVRVTVEVPPSDREHAARLEAIRRERLLADARRKERVAEARDLGGLLADPRFARLYWMNGDLEKMGDMREHGRLFEEVSELITKGAPTTSDGNPMLECVAECYTGLGKEQRHYFLDELRKLFVSFERSDLAERVEWPPG